MTDLHRFTYESTDVPPGMTLAEYRYRRVRPYQPGLLRRALARSFRRRIPSMLA